MNFWNVLEVLGARVLHTTWQATCLIGVVLVAQRLLRHRLAPSWRYALWLPVLVRLALPFTPPAAFSLFQWIPGGGPSPAKMASPSEGALGLRAANTVRLRTAGGNPMPDASEPEAGRLGVAAEFPSAPGAMGSTRRIESPTAQSLAEDPTSPSIQAEEAASTYGLAVREAGLDANDRGSWGWRRALAAAWGIGVLLFGVVWVAGWIRLRARIQGCPTVADPGLLRLWKECQSTLKVRGAVRLVESTAASGPALFGLGQLWLLLPPGFADRFTAAQQRHVFLHELAHLRRHDLAVHGIMALLQAVHWFNPFVWVAFARLRSAREEAADAMVLAAGSPAESRDYGFTVLQLVEEASRPSRLPGRVVILDEPRRLNERIESIARFRPGSPTSRWPLALVLGLALAGLTDAPRSVPAADATLDPLPADAMPPTEGEGEPGPVWPVVTNGPAVRVKVVDAATGQPLAGAEVVAPSQAAIWGLETPRSPRWTTDGSGEVTIHLGLRPGMPAQQEQWYTIAARRAGFAPLGRSWLIPRGVTQERVPEVAEFRLQRGQTVGGVVRDEAGRPLAGIRVRMAGSGYQYGPPGAQQYPEFWSAREDLSPTVTDAEGRWEVADFPSDLGQVLIECWRPDGMIHRFEGRKPASSAEVMFEREWGVPLDLGTFRAKEGAFVLPTGHIVHGRVVDPDGRPVGGARVRAAFGHERQTRAGETRSDASGRFEFSHRTPIEWIFTAEAEGFALSSVVVTAGAEAPEAQIRLERLNPLRLKVVDPAGVAIAGVRASVDPDRPSPQVLDFAGTTDSTGSLVWSNAPSGPLTLKLQAGSEGGARWVRLAPGERDREVRMQPATVTNVVVTGRCVEVGTGGPIEIATVAFRAQGTSEFSTVALETMRMLGEGRFQLNVPGQWFLPGMPRTYQLRLWAPGVGRVITELRDFDEGDWELVVPFRRGGAIRGTLRLPDGRPASDAVIAASGSLFATIGLSDRGFSNAPDWTQSHADVSGRYGIDDPGSDGRIVIRHGEGFLDIPASRLREGGDATLLPYGRIEGILRSDRRPVAGTSVMLRRDIYGRFGSVRWTLLAASRCGPDGAFVFTNVPAGDYVLNRPFPPPEGPNRESHPMPVRVESGVTLKVTYGGEGRPVVGRARAGTLQWQAVRHQLVARPTMMRPAWPDPNRFATAESYQRWITRYAGMNAWLAQRRIYGVLVERDGSFRAEDVPAGTYELELIPYDVRSSPDFTAPDAPRLRREVMIPPITEADRGVPLDLGVLEFPAETKGSAAGR